MVLKQILLAQSFDLDGVVTHASNDVGESFFRGAKVLDAREYQQGGDAQ